MEMEGPEAAAMRGGIPGVRPMSFQPPDFECRKLQFDSAMARRQGVPHLEDDEIGVVFADEAGGAADELAFDDSFVFTRKRNPMGLELLGNDGLDLSGARRKKRGPPLDAMLGVQDSSDWGSMRDDETVSTERRGPPTMPTLSCHSDDGFELADFDLPDGFDPDIFKRGFDEEYMKVRTGGKFDQYLLEQLGAAPPAVDSAGSVNDLGLTGDELESEYLPSHGTDSAEGDYLPSQGADTAEYHLSSAESEAADAFSCRIADGGSAHAAASYEADMSHIQGYEKSLARRLASDGSARMSAIEDPMLSGQSAAASSVDATPLAFVLSGAVRGSKHNPLFDRNASPSEPTMPVHLSGARHFSGDGGFGQATPLNFVGLQLGGNCMHLDDDSDDDAGWAPL